MLAPDVYFFLNSRKQGLPCWHSLSFFFLSIQYTTEIINTSRGLKSMKERTYGSFQNLPAPMTFFLV